MSLSFPQAVVVKVGGSLFDLPDLGPRLRRWLATLDTQSILLLPGGGLTANAVRELDRCHHLGEEASHWLALRGLSLNARFLAALLPNGFVVEGWDGCLPQWGRGMLPILDALAFAEADEPEAGSLPHCWDVTSDAVAARAAAVGGARRLVLLKSVDVPDGLTWADAAECGLVDPFFARTLVGGCSAQVVNLRTWQ
jgi:aspartokinase-like uncharacterized kinase